MKIKKLLICGPLVLTSYLMAHPANAQTMSQVEALRQITSLTQSANKALGEINKTNELKKSSTPALDVSKAVQEIKSPTPMTSAENKLIDLGVQGSLIVDEIKNTAPVPSISKFKSK